MFLILKFNLSFPVGGKMTILNINHLFEQIYRASLTLEDKSIYFCVCRSNPELCLSSDSDTDSDGGVTASQAASRLQDRLRAVRSFILSDSELYSQILQYQPLVVSQLQERLKAAGIRLGASKLLDYLDSQCITFTTAKPGPSAASRGRGRRAKAAGEGRVRGRKRVTARDY